MKLLPYIVSASSGIAVWIGIGLIIGNPEAWDNSLYFKGGVPTLALVAFILGLIEPKAPYRWGIIQGLSQSVVILGQGIYFGYSLNLWPPSVLVNIALALPSIISSYAGALINKKWQEY